MPDQPMSLAAIMAQNAVALDAMIADNVAQDKAFIAGTHRNWLTAYAKQAREELGITDGPDDSEPTATDDVAGQPETEVGEAEAG